MDCEPEGWRERRRFRALDLKEKDWKQKDIAEALGVTEGAVSQWLKRARKSEAEGGGREALKTAPRPGRPPKLSERERTEELPRLLEKGAEHFGFRGEVWTRGRVRKLIQEAFGVRYTPSQVGRILDKIGWSAQKPVHRAARRDDEAVQNWKLDEWPRIKKKPKQTRER